MKKIYGFLMAIIVLALANSVFGENVKTEIDPEKGGLVVYEQIEFHPLPDWLLDKNLDSSKILNIVKTGQGKILLEENPQKKWGWEFPIKIIEWQERVWVVYQKEKWNKELALTPPTENKSAGWIVTTTLFVSVCCLFTVSLIHQIKHKKESKQELIYFYCLLSFILVLFLFIPNIINFHWLIGLFLCSFGFVCLAICVYFGQKVDEFNNENEMLFLVTAVPSILLIFIIIVLYKHAEIKTFIVGTVGTFALINLLAYLTSRLWFKKHPAQPQ